MKQFVINKELILNIEYFILFLIHFYKTFILNKFLDIKIYLK
jgi:hypothetical protein